MTKKQRDFKKALAQYNRIAGQYKRYSGGEFDTEQFLQGKTTAKGVEKALKQMRIAYERPKIEARMEAYERRQYERYREGLEKEYRAQSEQAAKDADLAAKLNQYKTGYETFQENFDYELSETDFRELIDVWGGISEEMKEAYGGSDPDKSGYGNLVYAYKEIKNPVMRQNFPDMLKQVREENPGAIQEQLINELYKKIDEVNAAYDDKMEEEKN